ncbi:MAG: D-alanyl-lipoteichoic acid biosynthesis protein DltB [Coriobacteriia bacterium]|nr:D-alanyl-lipoteichoic acid biosynthesis protein DltB [Coriobacteriia bacterium]
MTFYAEPAFFILLVVAIIPAAYLGFTQRRIAPYGLAVSLVFLAFLFGKDLRGLAALAFYLCLETAVTFPFLRRRLKGGKSKALFWLCVSISVLPLVAYKVAAVFDHNLLGFLGISYMTFKAVQVVIEVHDGLIKELSLFDYLYFLLIFAPFTSGPIDRSRRFGEDVRRSYTKEEYADLFSAGILYVLLGAVYKLVLSGIFFRLYTPAVLTQTAFLWGSLDAVRDAYAYGLYLFFDFAGYSLMAVGVSYCFGIRTPRNFNAPFIALDIKDFWNRWHITLSSWLRDFVFMRITTLATKKRWFKSRLSVACCGYMANMILMGAWHGLTANYLAYGVYHGLLLSATEVFERKSKFRKRFKDRLWFKMVSWFVTINLVMFGFALFSGQVAILFKR